MFLIWDNETKEVFNSDNGKKTDEAVNFSGFHPSYRGFWMLDEEGRLQIENGCGEIRDVGERFYFICFVADLGYDGINSRFLELSKQLTKFFK